MTRAPIALADAGDHCARCSRPLNVNEPVFCAPGLQGAICGGCRDALAGAVVVENPRAANLRAFGAELQAMRTSELLRVAAATSVALAIPGSIRDRALLLSAELQLRAAAIELESSAAMLPPLAVQALLRRIGEVH